jgi:hypothetical protein
MFNLILGIRGQKWTERWHRGGQVAHCSCGEVGMLAAALSGICKTMYKMLEQLQISSNRNIDLNYLIGYLFRLSQIL